MTGPMAGSLEHVRIIGPGKMGLTLATELRASAAAGRISVEGRAATAPPHPLFESKGAEYVTSGAEPHPPPSLIVIAVPDGAIEAVARDLASRMRESTPVVHLSGARGLDVLEPLRRMGIPVGSVHPLVAATGSVEGPSRLTGGWFAVAADDDVAVGAARALVLALGGRTLSLPSGSKPVYHAATVFASNYVVTLLDTAERLLTESGVPATTAREAVTDLARGAVENVATLGPVNALTGPVSRGDDGTVALHLSGLSVDDRALYSTLALKTLELARRQGLEPAVADRVAAKVETP